MTTTQQRDPVLRRLGRFTVRRRRWVLVVAGLVTVLVGVFGSGALSALSLSRYEVRDSESHRAATVLAEQFGSGSPNLVLLVSARNGTVDDPAVSETGLALTRELSTMDQIAEVASYWSRGSTPALRSDDGRQALVLARVPGSATQARTAIERLAPQLTRETAVITVGVGGQDWVFRQVSQQAASDFLRAEMIIIPAVLLLLFLLYRRMVVALATLGIGLFSIIATLAALRGLTGFTEVSTFAANVTLVMGLALGVDYCLFIVARFRDELAEGRDVGEAVERTVATAGRTVLFSGLTVAASLSMLLLFPFPLLQSFGYAGVLVVVTAVIGALIILPAMLASLGQRAARRAPTSSASGDRFWARTATLVMRRPVLTGGVTLVLLLGLAAPVLGLRFGLPDDRVLPQTASSRMVQDQIRAGFGQEETDAIRIVAPELGDPTASREEIVAYAEELSRLPGIAQVDSAFGSYTRGRPVLAEGAESARMSSERGTWWSAIPTRQALDGGLPALVNQIRSLPAPTHVLVGGYPADLADFRDALTDRLPLVVGLILAVTFAILFLMTGSVLLPAKATALNLLSLSVMFGVIVWGFQRGNLAGVLGFTPVGSMEPSIPILMFCIAYGLSMDYEVFMVSRIAEEHARTGDTTRAVVTGIQRSAPLITAAGGILALCFAVYATGRVVLLQMLGIGMAVAVLVDATLIRAVLVPSLMRLAGAANWWAPRPLRRLHERFGLQESTSDSKAPEPEPVAARA